MVTGKMALRWNVDAGNLQRTKGKKEKVKKGVGGTSEKERQEKKQNQMRNRRPQKRRDGIDMI